MKIFKKNIFIIGIILILFSFFFLFSNYSLISSSTSDIEYSYVLNDLHKDENFNIEDFPLKDEYSLEIIQIAESQDNELFIYIYQPCVGRSDLLATRVSLSIKSSYEEDDDFKFYNLKYLNSAATLYKYKVEGIEILKNDIRCYNINAVYRKFDDKLDSELESGNKIIEVPYNVSMKWIVTYEDDKLVYSSIGTEVVTVADKYVGFVRYKDGFNLKPTSCDSYFICFSCDRPIDRLISAEVYYISQTYKYYDYFTGRENYYFDAEEENYKTINYTDKVQFDGSIGIFKHKFSWNRIQTVDEFISNEEVSKNLNLGFLNYGITKKLSDDVLNSINGMQWVLRFVETDFSVTVHNGSANYYVTNGTIIENVSLMQLTFEYDGKVYNLGVVDNIQSPTDYIPDNETTQTIKPSSLTFKIIGYIFIGLVLIISFVFIFKIIRGDDEFLTKFVEILLIIILLIILIVLIYFYFL